MRFTTPDLCDAHPEATQVAEASFRRFGRKTACAGPAHPIAVFEDNTHVRGQLETEGAGRMLVVDGGGSLRCALVGDRLAQLAIDHGWAGIVVFGALRDSAVIDGMDVGVWALGTSPRKSIKRGQGVVGAPIRFAGIVVRPGDWVYADADGVVVGPPPEPGA